MLLRPLAAAAALVAADWGLWNWAIGGSHGTIALIAGLAMAPLAVTFVWFGARVLASALRAAVRRAHARTQGPALRARTSAQTLDAAGATERTPDRLAA
jgi:hypothetical protein